MIAIVAALVVQAGALESDLKRYEEAALELVMESGWNPELRRHGNRVPLGVFGAAAADTFAQSVRAQHEAESYRVLRLGGVAGIVGGLVCAAISLPIAIAGQGNWRWPLTYALWSTGSAA